MRMEVFILNLLLVKGEQRFSSFLLALSTDFSLSEDTFLLESRAELAKRNEETIRNIAYLLTISRTTSGSFKRSSRS